VLSFAIISQGWKTKKSSIYSLFRFALLLYTAKWKTKKSGTYSYELGGCKLHFEFPVYALQSKGFENVVDAASDNPIDCISDSDSADSDKNPQKAADVCCLEI
jgi:hypothetical protein